MAYMSISEATLLGFAAALGSGLLIGIERERRKGTGPARALGGVRTFALTALAGAVAKALQEPRLIAVGALLIGALAVVAYWRRRGSDPGVTTGVALVVTYLLGVMAIEQPIAAAASAVVVTILLAGRRPLHQFSVRVLSESELRDGLTFAAAALILLPLTPDQSVPWLAGANPRRLWSLVVLFMALQAAGYVALRAVGARIGLAVSGLAAGFVSSTGTIAALGARSRLEPGMRNPCVAGAMFSSVATVVLLVLVVLAVCPAAFLSLAPSLGLALLVVIAAAFLSLRRQRDAVPAEPTKGRAFNLLYALGFAASLTAITAGVTFTSRYFGVTAAGLTAGLAGAFDVHAAAASTLSLAARGALPVADARLPVLVAFTANTGSKLVAAYGAGGRRFGTQVALGLVATAAATWVPLLWGF